MNFDEYIDRNEYLTLKWDKAFLAEYFGNENAIPMAIADMDLKSPPAVIEQLQKRVAHGIFGYEWRSEPLFAALGDWYENRHGWRIAREHMHASASVLNAIAVLIEQHSDEGDGVIVQPPVFSEFDTVIRDNHRKIVNNPLKLADGHYEMDFDDLEAKATDPNNKILILCNPHNPVGRVWTETELTRVAEICERHNVFVISDEIHADFVFPPHHYVPYLSISEKAAQHSAACLSPAKTFNIAGIMDAIVVIPNGDYLQQFHEFEERYQINHVNVFASAAGEAAYREGAGWLDAALTYIRGNVDLIKDFLQQHDLGISFIEPEGTFLVWMDFRALGLSAKELAQFLADAGVALSLGHWYGKEGAGFARMAVACPRATVQRALYNLAAAVKTLT